MGLKGAAAIVGCAEYKPEKYNTAPRAFHLSQVADLAWQALQDAGMEARQIDGIVLPGTRFNEAREFIPAMTGEYLGLKLNYGEVVDLGGANGIAMAWRAAAAIELGICEAVLCVIPMRIPIFGADADPTMMIKGMRYGGHSTTLGAPEAEFDIPYGHIAQNTGYAMIAQRYAAKYGYDPRAMAKIVVDQRTNACANPNAIFYNQPLSIEDVLNSRMVADPLHVLEIVMPIAGGAAFIVTRKDMKRKNANRPAIIKGFGEHIQSKSPSYAEDMIRTPIGPASQRAFAMAGVKPGDVDLAQIYDCYTITVLLTLEDAGFCAKGDGMRFVMENDLTYRGSFPMNTHGGQLGFGQAGMAGGMSQIVEAVRQIRGSCGERQLKKVDLVYVSGTGGVMSEQTALILQGE